LSFTTLNCQQARKRIGTDHEFALFRRGNKLPETNPLLIQQDFAEIRSVTSEYSAIYTDGSKDGDRVTSAAVFGQQIYSP
jgi:hypothetical protein